MGRLAKLQERITLIRILLQNILEVINKQVRPQLISEPTLTLIQANWVACQATGQSSYLSSNLKYDLIKSLLCTCYQGSVPNYYVEAQQISDVQKIT
jgi:hypothetical protein